MNDSHQPPPIRPAFERILSVITDAWPVDRWCDYGVLVAVSGGADSVALLRGLVHLKRERGGSGPLVVGHIDHGVRENSSQDAAWIRHLAQELQLDCVVRRLDQSRDDHPRDSSGTAPTHKTAEPDARELADSPPADEASLRSQRYRELLNIARQKGLRYIATAHHQDDQLETILFRIFRGTGLTGLQGIPRQRVVDSITIVRPLLDARRELIVDALAELKQPFRDDPTNALNHYTRNFLRNELIPLIESRFADWDASLLRLAEQTEAWTRSISDRVRKLRDSAVSHIDDGWQLDIHPVQDTDPFELQFLLQQLWDEAGWPRADMGHDQWSRLLDAIREEPPPAPFMLPGAVRVSRDDTRLQLRRQS